MKAQNFFALTLVCLFATGCAVHKPTEVYHHTPARDYKVNNSKVIDEGFDKAWNDAVRSLSSTFYTINNIEKSSRIINVSFSIKDPTKYVDCGISRREFSYKNETANYVYATAGDGNYQFLSGSSEGYSYWSKAKRENSISGVANIYFLPISENKTEITVNANYSLNTSLKGKRYSLRKSGDYLFENNFNNEFVTELTTNSPSPFNDDSEFLCKSTQVLETALLEVLSKG